MQRHGQVVVPNWEEVPGACFRGNSRCLSPSAINSSIRARSVPAFPPGPCILSRCRPLPLPSPGHLNSRKLVGGGFRPRRFRIWNPLRTVLPSCLGIRGGDCCSAPHCTSHSSTTTGPNGTFLGALERSHLGLPERLGAHPRKERGKNEKWVHQLLLGHLSLPFRYFYGLCDASSRTAY